MASVDDVKLRNVSVGQHAESRTRADSAVLFDIQTGANIRPGHADQVLDRSTTGQGPLVFLLAERYGCGRRGQCDGGERCDGLTRQPGRDSGGDSPPVGAGAGTRQ
jgi:hypothetical protein